MRAFAIVVALLLSSGAFAQPTCERVLSTSTEVESFDSKTPWGKQIFLRDLQAVKADFESIKSLEPIEQVQFLLKNDTRRIFFRLQSLSRIYSSMDAKTFKNLRDEFKKYEDLLGKVDLAKTLRKASEKVEEPELVEVFRQQEEQARAALLQVFEKDGIFENSNKVFSRLEKEMRKSGGWKSAKKDRQYLAEILLREIDKLDKDARKGIFDDADIEIGLHELRRRLRWIVIGVTTLSGTVQFKTETQLSRSVDTWFRELQDSNPDLMANKYLRIMEPVVSNPIQVPHKSMVVIAELVERIGRKKDNAEIQIYLHEAMENKGASHVRLQELQRKLHEAFEVDTVDHQGLSRDIQNRVSGTGLLKDLARGIEADL